MSGARVSAPAASRQAVAARRGAWSPALPQGRGWVGWAWGAAAAALIGWFAAPLPDEGPPLVKPRRDVWVMAPLPRVMDQTTLAVQVMGLSYWGAVPANAAVPATLPTDAGWRLAGIFGVGSERSVLVEFVAEGRPPQRLGVGERLPSGHRITRIDENAICVEIGRRSYRLGVERVAS